MIKIVIKITWCLNPSQWWRTTPNSRGQTQGQEQTTSGAPQQDPYIWQIRHSSHRPSHLIKLASCTNQALWGVPTTLRCSSPKTILLLLQIKLWVQPTDLTLASLKYTIPCQTLCTHQCISCLHSSHILNFTSPSTTNQRPQMLGLWKELMAWLVLTLRSKQDPWPFSQILSRCSSFQTLTTISQHQDLCKEACLSSQDLWSINLWTRVEQDSPHILM